MPESRRQGPLLIGFDGRPAADDALRLGVVLANAAGASIVVAWMYGHDPVLGTEPRSDARDEAQRALDGVRERLGADGVRAETRAITGRSPAHALYRLADELDPWALVAGSSHRGPVGRLLAGSTVTRLLQGAPCPVVVAPKGYADRAPERLRTVSVGFDGSPDAWAALQHAADVAVAAGAHLRLIAAVGPFVGGSIDPSDSETLIEKRTRHAEIELARGCASVSGRLRPESVVVALDPRWALEAEADKADVDLVVVGSRGYGPLHHVFAGSVSTALVHSSATPLMVVPRSLEPRLEADSGAGEGVA